MLQNYLKIAFRNLFKNKLFSLINLIGLSIGTAIVILIMLFVKNEWTYDQFHANSDHIYRAWVKEHFKGELLFNTVTPLLLGDELKNNFPEVRESARYLNVNTLIRNGAVVEEETVHYVDPAFFKIFDFELLKGKRNQVFSTIHQAIITQETGLKYFNDDSPIGQTITIQVGGEWKDFTIGGVIENAPTNSSLTYEILLPFENTRPLFSDRARACWTCVYGETYIMTDPSITLADLNAKIAPFIDDKVKDDYQAGEYIVGLQPIADIHLNNEVPQGIVEVSDARYPYILASVALLILILACINFTTLSIGRSVSRAKEVGVRKVTGATKWQLRIQFWSEAIITAILALLIGLALSVILLPFFNALADQQLVLEFSPQNILFFLGLAISIGLLAGIYPAVVLSSFAPIQAIKGVFSKLGNDKHVVLRYLVGFQFVLSIFLIICTFGMNKQMNYLQNKNLGYNKDQIIVVPYNGTGQSFVEDWNTALQVKERLRKDLTGKSVRQIISSSHTVGTRGWGQVGYTEPETDQFRQFNVQQIDFQYLDVMNIRLADGRNFKQDNTTDNRAAIVNEAYAKAYQLDNPIGKTLPGPYKDYRIIGMTNDFNYNSLHSPIEPLVMVTDFVPLLQAAPDLNFTDNPIPKFSLKVETENLRSTIAQIQNIWKNVTEEQSFSYTFLDENIEQQYRAEEKLSQILGIATFLAIIVACLGLFGIATLIIAQRTKEIGVRKILGANTTSIVLLLNKHFSILVLVASIIAIPIGWYMMNEWLADFEYRTSMSWWIFVLAVAAALCIAWLSVSYQSIRAALTNPINSLRSE